MLSNIWLGLFFIAATAGLIRWLDGSDPQVFAAMSIALFESAKSAFELAIGMAGNLMLWTGLLAVAQKSGAIQIVGRLVAPLLQRVFPGLPADHPASGAIVLNFATNALGLDNAATPAGLKAMRELQRLNPSSEIASDHQVMFMVLHAASLTLFPIGIIALRAAAGAANPTDLFLPVLVVSCCSAGAGFLSAAAVQRLPIDRTLALTLLLGITALSVGFWELSQLPAARIEALSSQISGFVLIAAILWFFALAAWKRIDAWASFIEGAGEGLLIVWQIAPYLVGMIVAVGQLRASGALDALAAALTPMLSFCGLPTDAANALPTMLMKPLSGSAARGLMVEVMHTQGPDSYAARLAGLFQGGTDTTFYVLALYSGAAGLKRLRHTLPCALIADLAGWIAAIFVATRLFH